MREVGETDETNMRIKSWWLCVMMAMLIFTSTGCENSPTDAGPIWTKYWTVVYESKQPLYQIIFTGPEEAWVVGYYNMVHYQNGNYTTVNLPKSIYAIEDYALIRISFCDPNHGWVIGTGTFGGGSAVIYRYINGVWEELPPLDGYQQYDSFFSDVKALSPDNVWVAGNKIWHFDGTGWSSVVQLDGILPKRFCFLNNNDGYLTFINGFMGGGVLHWNGNAWEGVFGSEAIQPRAIAFDNLGQGYMVTWSVGGIYQVGDWVPVESSQYFAGFTDIESNSTGDIWAVGQTTLLPSCNVLAHWDGLVWHYERTIPTTEFHSLFVKENGEVWSTVHTGETDSVAFLNLNQ